MGAQAVQTAVSALRAAHDALAALPIDALTAVLGREACARRCCLTMDELIQENKKLEFDLTGLRV